MSKPYSPFLAFTRRYLVVKEQESSQKDRKRSSKYTRALDLQLPLTVTDLSKLDRRARRSLGQSCPFELTVQSP